VTRLHFELEITQIIAKQQILHVIAVSVFSTLLYVFLVRLVVVVVVVVFCFFKIN